MASIYLFGLVVSSDPFMQVLGGSLGSILIVGCLGFLYVKSGASLSEKGLRILDWLFIGMTLAMMGCFQLLGVDPYYWILFVVFPLLGVRIAIGYFLKRKPSHIRLK